MTLACFDSHSLHDFPLNKSDIYLVQAKTGDCSITGLLRREGTLLDDLLITLSKVAAIFGLQG